MITLKTTGKTVVKYKPGDVFNIRPRNSKEDVEDLFSIFKEHNIDILPHYNLVVEEYHDGKFSCKYFCHFICMTFFLFNLVLYTTQAFRI